jgi:hypothetical protein
VARRNRNSLPNQWGFPLPPGNAEKPRIFRIIECPDPNTILTLTWAPPGLGTWARYYPLSAHTATGAMSQSRQVLRNLGSSIEYVVLRSLEAIEIKYSRCIINTRIPREKVFYCSSNSNCIIHRPIHRPVSTFYFQRTGAICATHFCNS